MEITLSIPPTKVTIADLANPFHELSISCLYFTLILHHIFNTNLFPFSSNISCKVLWPFPPIKIFWQSTSILTDQKPASLAFTGSKATIETLEKEEEIYLKLKIKTTEKHHWCNVVDNDVIIWLSVTDIIWLTLFLTFKYILHLFLTFFVDFEQVKVGWTTFNYEK